MSMSSSASITYILRNVSPRMFMLATVIPFVSHFFRFVFVLCFLLRDPFVRYSLCYFLPHLRFFLYFCIFSGC
jgi:hypothetical protein